MTEVHDLLRAWWDRDADSYDDAPSHSLASPEEAWVWRRLLNETLPEPPARILDVGAGTGALSILAAELGHRVVALDFSDRMLAIAKRKAAERGVAIEAVHGLVEHPPAGPFDVVMGRHILWTLPDPLQALRAWREVTVPGGRLLLFEGSWTSGGPVSAVRAWVAACFRRIRGLPEEHHAPYPEGALPHLPLGRRPDPAKVAALLHQAGWQHVRGRRLYEVERLRSNGLLLSFLEHVSRYAISAGAPLEPGKA